MSKKEEVNDEWKVEIGPFDPTPSSDGKCYIEFNVDLTSDDEQQQDGSARRKARKCRDIFNSR